MKSVLVISEIQQVRSDSLSFGGWIIQDVPVYVNNADYDYVSLPRVSRYRTSTYPSAVDPHDGISLSVGIRAEVDLIVDS
jgi:hypothetical protein